MNKSYYAHAKVALIRNDFIHFSGFGGKIEWASFNDSVELAKEMYVSPNKITVAFSSLFFRIA
jgi:hypothetical protein